MNKGLILCLIIALSMLILGVQIGKQISKEVHEEQCKEKYAVSFSLDSPGMCKVEQGGKAWLLIDISEEFPQMDTLQEAHGSEKIMH